MNTKNTGLWLIIVIIVIGSLYYWMRPSAPAPMNATTSKNLEKATATPAAANTIEITASGYTPNEIKIKKGDTVTWINKDSAPHWPATAMHPAHEGYDGTNLAQHCAAGATLSFDACKGLMSGESYTFKFDKVGTWKYHDHLKPVAPFFGSVIVE